MSSGNSYSPRTNKDLNVASCFLLFIERLYRKERTVSVDGLYSVEPLIYGDITTYASNMRIYQSLERLKNGNV